LEVFLPLLYILSLCHPVKFIFVSLSSGRSHEQLYYFMIDLTCTHNILFNLCFDLDEDLPPPPLLMTQYCLLLIVTYVMVVAFVMTLIDVLSHPNTVRCQLFSVSLMFHVQEAVTFIWQQSFSSISITLYLFCFAFRLVRPLGPGNLPWASYL